MSDVTRLRGVQPVEGVAGGVAVPVSGTVTVDTSALATAAKQDTQSTKLDTLHTDVGNVETKLDTLHTDVSGITGKLPPAPGAQTSANSLSIVLATDGLVRVAAPENATQNVRTWNAASADSEPAVDGSSWVSLTGANAAGIAELYYNITAVGGTVAPTQVIFRTWIRIGGGGGTIVKVDEWPALVSFLTLSSPTNPYRRRPIPVNCDEIFVTATFPDGSSPTITGTVDARAVTNASLLRRDFTYDEVTGLPKFHILGYDLPSDTLKMTPAYIPTDLYNEEPLVMSLTGQAIATYYAPSSDGLLVGKDKVVTFEYDLTGANGGTVAISYEATLGSNSWTSPKDVTKSGFDPNTGINVTGTITSGANGTISGMAVFGQGNSPVNYTRLRAKVVVAGGVSGALSVSTRRTP